MTNTANHKIPRAFAFMLDLLSFRSFVHALGPTWKQKNERITIRFTSFTKTLKTKTLNNTKSYEEDPSSKGNEVDLSMNEVIF